MELDENQLNSYYEDVGGDSNNQGNVSVASRTANLLRAIPHRYYKQFCFPLSSSLVWSR